MRDTALWPCLDGQQQAFGIQLAELLCHGAEACPDTDHKVGMLLVYVLNQLLAVGKILRQEVHGVPQVVGAPVLPVLDNTIQGHLQFAVLINNALGFGSGLVTLLRLPETIGPQWKHGHIATQMAHLCNHAIGRTTIHKVIVDHVACL